MNVGGIVQLLDQEGCDVLSAEFGAAFGIVDNWDTNDGPIERTLLDDPFFRSVAANEAQIPVTLRKNREPTR